MDTDSSIPLSSELAHSLASQQPQPEPDYLKSLSYWESVTSDDNGMLGGFPQVSHIDIQGSSNFLAKLKPQMAKSKPWRAVDCGAGIGRVTKHFLSKKCDIVDIVEPVRKFTDEILHSPHFEPERDANKIGDIFNLGLENFKPLRDTYWLIWVQWCVGHLPDDDLVSFLKRCGDGLKYKGCIVVKENVCPREDEYDDVDSSVTRTDESFRRIFEKAEMKVVKMELQRGFPESLGLYPVKMYALQPKWWK